MESIIRVTRCNLYPNGHDSERHRYFHGIEAAKRWCERDVGQDIDWQNFGDVNPQCWFSPEFGDDYILTYDLEPITIEVMDEDDGEV